MTEAAATSPGELDRVADGLKTRAAGAPDETLWPGRQWDWLRETGVLRWGIPVEFGGIAVAPRELLSGYIALARACLTTTFVLTQRNGACQRIAQSLNNDLRSRLLPRLARGEIFATVGISHLTTSRQHLSRPAVLAVSVADGFELTGEIPWVTGAPQAQYIVTGGALSDGRQLLASVATNSPGVAVAKPIPLLALSGSQTSSVTLNRVQVAAEDLVHPPIENVMRQGANVSTGSLSTSALALGHAWGAIEALRSHANQRPELSEFANSLTAEAQTLEQDLLQLAGPDPCGPSGGTNESVRVRANSLVLRSTQVLLAATKGAGFVAGSFAERAVREALFFLVWSCPQPVVSANVREMVEGGRRKEEG